MAVQSKQSGSVGGLFHLELGVRVLLLNGGGASRSQMGRAPEHQGTKAGEKTDRGGDHGNILKPVIKAGFQGKG